MVWEEGGSILRPLDYQEKVEMDFDVLLENYITYNKIYGIKIILNATNGIFCSIKTPKCEILAYLSIKMNAILYVQLTLTLSNMAKNAP